ncbi:MAG: CvpA family protein [Bacteroidales bacterium]|jgi:membrane protein required for colicin V production|nr:CvpA family protein [Bacteroidales bacterium]
MMKIVDTIILIFLIWFIIKGFRKGLMDGVFSILALLIGGWATARFTDDVCSFLKWNTETKCLLAAGITFLGIAIAVLLIGKICKSAINFVLPVFVDKILGMLFGAVKVLLFFGILFYLVSNVDTNEKIISREQKERSFFYAPSLKIAGYLLPAFQKIKTRAWTTDKIEENTEEENVKEENTK